MTARLFTESDRARFNALSTPKLARIAREFRFNLDERDYPRNLQTAYGDAVPLYLAEAIAAAQEILKNRGSA